MLTVYATLTSLSPMFQDAMSDEVLEGLRTGVFVTKPKDVKIEEQAEMGLYLDPSGNGDFGIPGQNLFGCFREGGRYIKVKGKQISLADKTTILPSLLTIPHEFLPFKNGASWVVDKRRGANKKGEALCVVRPRFDQWEIDVTLLVEDSEVDIQTIHKLVTIAGSKIGLCGFRPTCGGPFGRFEISKWEVVDADGKKVTTKGKKTSRTSGNLG